MEAPSLVLDRVVRSSEPDQQLEASQASLEISLVITHLGYSSELLKRTNTLAESLRAHINLIAIQIVPYPLPLTSPPVLAEFNEKRFRLIARESRVDTVVQLYLCRDRVEALLSILPHDSLVVVGVRRTWWPTADKALTKTLKRAGHELVVLELE